MLAVCTFLRMPADQAAHPGGPGEPCTVCYEPGRLGHNVGCSGTETQHWFCNQCVVKLHQCSICRQRHPLCTGPPPRETQHEDLMLATIRMLATQKIWAPRTTMAAGTAQMLSG